MLFRYSIMVDVFNARLPQELVCKNKLDDELKKKILRKPYTEQIDRLIFLYGVGVLNTEALKSLVLHNDLDFLSDGLAVCDKNGKRLKNSGHYLSEEQLAKALERLKEPVMVLKGSF
ncbi:MAG: hypothetical protein K2N26_09760 [Oscillospiraceae bacterium]|nr:hypothetical protein [Oscillospiraceae bacterium]